MSGEMDAPTGHDVVSYMLTESANWLRGAAEVGDVSGWGDATPSEVLRWAADQFDQQSAAALIRGAFEDGPS